MENVILDNTSSERISEKNYFDRVLSLAVEVGCGLLSCGCPVSRVEIAVELICKAYGAAEVNVFTIPSMILAVVRLSDESEVTQMKRVYSISNNFEKMEKYNQLSRDICTKKYELHEAAALAAQLRRRHNPGKLALTLSGGVGAGAFAVFYGGTLVDALPAALIGGLMAFSNCLLSRLAFNGYARTFMLSVIGGVLSVVCSWLLCLCGLPCCSSMIMIGTIMVVVPGLVVCNAVRDLFSGEIYSGTFELLNGILITLAIVAGYGASMFVLRDLVNISDPAARSGEWEYYLYRILSCIVGSLAFTVMFNNARKRLIASVFNIVFAFAVYLVMEKFVGDLFVDILVATMAAAFVSEIFARKFKAPSIIFFVPGIIVLVPGGTFYYTVFHLVSGNAASALAYGQETGLILLGIAVGIIVITVVFQLIHPSKQRKYLRKKINMKK